MNEFLEKSPFKHSHGEINTPFTLVNKMLHLLPDDCFNNPNLKWLDAGCGKGNITYCICSHLQKNHKRKHIINNMVHMIEVNEKHEEHLKTVFDKSKNIFIGDFVTYQFDTSFDVIVSNPPFNIGEIKTPTNSNVNKKNDGKSIWREFIKKSLNIVKDDGYLCFIIPSIWLKPDKAGIYELLLQYKITKMQCLTNTQTNLFFKGQAQTPTCFFVLQKTPRNNEPIMMYDKKKFVPYHIRPDYPIPVNGTAIVNKLLSFVDTYGYITVHKTNLPSKNTSFSKTNTLPYKNVKTCILEDNKPSLVFNYSDKPCAFYNIPKLILAHKMYGFPFNDVSGVLGISDRDSYIISDYTSEQLSRWSQFLSTSLSLFIFETAKYRMRYLEKYAFMFIPDITKIKNFPDTINDQTLFSFFGFDSDEIETILNYHPKNYSFF